MTKTLGLAAFYLVIASQTLCVKLAGGSRMVSQRQDLNRVALYLKVKQGQKLSGHVILTHQVRSEMECLHSCLSRDKCVSFNYGLCTSKSRHICELNSGSRKSPGHVFETSDGFSYYEPSTMTLPQQDFVFHNQSHQHDAQSTVDAAVESTATSPVISSVFSKRSSSSLMTSALLSSVMTSAMPYATSSQPLTCPLVSSSFIASSSSSFMTSIQPSASWDNSASSSAVQQVEPASCKYLNEQRKSFQSQVYTLMFGSQKIPVYCHMGNLSGCSGGGWTLVMKIDGTKTTFHYDSTFWTNRTAFNLAGGKTGFDHQETKLPSYWTTPFSKVCLGMKIGNQTKIAFIVIEKHANSLYSLIADGKYRNTSLGRDLWKKLLGSYASLQQNCSKEGFNSQALASTKSKARIGIIGNDQDDCKTCDSRIGFGTGGEPNDNNSCGNEATNGGDNKSRRIKAMGYILVQ